MEPNKPADVLRDGNLKATLWANNGENGTYITATFAKTYTDKSGKPRDTSSFSGAEMLRVAELARGAYHKSNVLRAQFNANQQGKRPLAQPSVEQIAQRPQAPVETPQSSPEPSGSFDPANPYAA